MTFNILGEPFIEFIMRVEEGWHDEMEKSPQLQQQELNMKHTQK
jgi:hypothetical protein